jgi:hypothetical protein
MFQNPRFSLAIALVGSIAFASASINSYGQGSGQRTFAQASVEPAIDFSTGGTIYLLTPIKAPFPAKANPVATAPLYLPLYPESSTVVAGDLNCQPTNCDHANVLPFPDPGYYGALPGTDPACVDFNGGQPCATVKGHDHLVGVAKTHGDFNVAWTVKPVIFTHKAFEDGMINTRILTLSQLMAEVASGDVVIAPDLVTFNCSVTSARTYELGTPVVIPFP